MRNSLVRLCLLTVLFAALPAILPAANESAVPKRVPRPPLYDATKEVTLEGTVESLITTPAPGKMLGGHLMVATATGSVDGQIGEFVLHGSHPFTATPGEKVKITGVMATIHGQQAFLVRTIETPEGTVEVRDAHGFFVFPGAHPPVSRTSSGISTQGGAR